MDVTSAMEKICLPQGPRGGSKFADELMEESMCIFGCQTFMREWSEKLENFLLNRSTNKPRILAAKFCGNGASIRGKPVESMTNACYNITLQDLPEQKYKWSRRYFIWSPQDDTYYGDEYEDL